MLGTVPLTIKSDETEKCDILLYLIHSDSEEAFWEEEKNSLLKQKLEIVQKYKVNAPAGEVLVQIWKPIKKENEYLTVFVYKVREDLYFEGTFWLAKEKHVQKNEWIAAIFQNVSMPWAVEE